MISPDLISFIGGSIRSVWALELLLVLKRDEARAWTAGQLVQEMRASAPLVGDVLGTFETAGLVRSEGERAYRYDPASPVLRDLCDELERAYRERPSAVIKTILSSPNDKLQSFADAFRFKGEAK